MGYSFSGIGMGEQFCQLSRIPKRLNVGDIVYFVKKRSKESSAKVKRIIEQATIVCEITNRN